MAETKNESSTVFNADSNEEDVHKGSMKEMDKGPSTEFHGHSKDAQLDQAAREEKLDKGAQEEAAQEEKESEIVSHEGSGSHFQAGNVEQIKALDLPVARPDSKLLVESERSTST